MIGPRQWWKALTRGSRPQLGGVLGERDFRAALEVELSLVDRNYRRFSLLTFEPDPRMVELAGVALERKRFVDVIGWIEGSRLGLLLRGTEAEGAKRYADEVLAAFQVQRGGADEPLPRYTIGTYPSDSEDPDQDQGQDGSSKEQPTTIPNRPHPVWKRGMDVVGSVTGLVFFSPVMLCVAGLIKATSSGPVFFRQERTGEGLRRFKMLKFRTMRVGAEGELERLTEFNEMNGPLFKARHDPRMTKVGKFLRKTSLDEIPQFFNVLKGDMCLVGPRALSPLPSAYEPWQLRRFFVRPGLACLWQVQNREGKDFTEWMRSDVRYVQQRTTLLSDVMLLFRIGWRVASCRGGQ